MEGSCFGANCATLKSQSFAETNKCAVQDMVKEEVDGCECSLSLFSLIGISRTDCARCVGLENLPGVHM